MRPKAAAISFSVILFCTLIPPFDARRSGGGGFGRSGGGGFGRSSSGARSGGGFGRGTSGSRGTLFGGSRPAARNDYARGTNFGGNSRTGAAYPPRTSAGGGGWNQGGGVYRNTGMNRGTGMSSGSKGGLLGGLFGRKSNTNMGYGSRSRAMPRFTSSGIGSRSRSSQFKNMIVGAAAGYLSYQAGKAIIRAATRPMMWNNRPYYWGANHYRGGPGHQQMCRMPIDSSDPQFGNVYFEDQTRPREITWGCGYYEYCCGYECCRGGDASSNRFGYGGGGASIGYAILAIYTIRRLMF